jgi:polyvinyl alcohol dehydrogenase (cytochrome)
MSSGQRATERAESSNLRFSLLAVIAGSFVIGCGGTIPSRERPPATATRVPAASATPSASPSPTVALPEWSTYGRTQSRSFFNPFESRITRANVAGMRLKWEYLTGAIVTASPTISHVDVAGEGRIKVVFVPSWDGNLYALRAANGSRLWHYVMKPHPGAAFPQAASVEVATVAGEQRVYAAGGMTLYCLAASTGELRWQFDAGTGCTTCDRFTERNQIESSPTVVGRRVFFSMDVNDNAPGKGGSYAVDAMTGRLIWYFDLQTGATCRPFESDEVRKFDGHHAEDALGLPDDFFATRPGCDFDRTSTGCGSVWSSFAVDAGRGLIYTASSNCDTDDDPDTVEPPPPMPPYDEALFALTLDGDPAWVWRPREVDNNDLAFGGVPNLFAIDIGGAERDVVGVGNKDGTYYVLDRNGTNELTGRVEPYWQRKVVAGGPIGGIIASAAVGEGKILFSTAVGVSLNNPQRPAAWGLHAADGTVLWSNANAPPSYGPTTAIPGVAFMGSIFPGLFAYDSNTGELLHTFPPATIVASAATVIDGEIFVGSGIGERGSNVQAAEQSFIPNPVRAYCLADAPDCPSSACDDGNPCTHDFHVAEGCESEPALDTLPCVVEAQLGQCRAGTCAIGPGAQ